MGSFLSKPKRRIYWRGNKKYFVISKSAFVLLIVGGPIIFFFFSLTWVSGPACAHLD